MRGRSRQKWRRWLIVASVSLALLVAVFCSLPWLVMAPAQPRPSEVILHLAIDPRSDSNLYVAELYRQGMASKIICVSSPVAWEAYPADYARRHLIALGVPEEDVSALHVPLTDCAAEVLPHLVEYVKAGGWRSALLVVAPAGSRLGRQVAERYFNRAGIRVSVTYSLRDRQELLDGWWRTYWKAQRIVSAAMGSALDLLYPQCW